MDRFFSHSEQSEIFNQFDKGKITVPEFRNHIREMTKMPQLDDQTIDDTWNSLLIGVPKGRHTLLLALKEKYRTFLLSNNNELHYNWILNYLQNEYKIKDNSSFFEKDYYSHLMGMRKPDPEIFEYVLQKHQLNAKETLFIDDSPQHLATAHALGIVTELATPDRPLEKIIEEYKLL